MENFLLGLLAELLAEPIVALLFLVILPGGSILLGIHKRHVEHLPFSWGSVLTALLLYLMIGLAVFWRLSTDMIGKEQTSGIFLYGIDTSISLKPENVGTSVPAVDYLLDTKIPAWPTVSPTPSISVTVEMFVTPSPTDTVPAADVEKKTVSPTHTPSSLPSVEPWCSSGNLRITRIEPNAQTIDARVIQDIHIWGGAHNTPGFVFDTFFVEAKKQFERPMLDHIERWNPVIAQFADQLGRGGQDQLLATWPYDRWQLLFDEGQNDVVVWIRVAGVNSQGNGRSMESACFVKLRLTR